MTKPSSQTIFLFTILLLFFSIYQPGFSQKCNLVIEDPNEPLPFTTFTRSQNTNSSLDTDGDSLTDDVDSDDDNDGMPDTWEKSWNDYAKLYSYQQRFNTTNSSDAFLDYDEDGFNNVNEYISNTNPYDNHEYPNLVKPNPNPKYNWSQFLVLLVISIIITMAISIIIGIYIIRKRRGDEHFWQSTFGTGSDSPELSAQERRIFRDKYLEWSNKVESEKIPKILSRYKYKLEIIGGPDDEDELSEHDVLTSRKKLQKSIKERDPKFKGKYCLWCDKAITKKYLKKCTGMRKTKKRCSDGPFCSKRCLNEHLNTVPHFHEVGF
jgi:hypothetical protein